MINTQELYAMAQAVKACDKVEHILSSTPEELVRLYRYTIDFCLEENFPSVEYLEKDIGKEFLSNNGIFVNQQASIVNNDFIVSLGASSLQVEVNQWNVSRIYVKHDSTLELTAKDNSFVILDCFDNSNVTIHAEGKAKVLVYTYNEGKVQVSKIGEAHVEVKRKEKVDSEPL